MSTQGDSARKRATAWQLIRLAVLASAVAAAVVWILDQQMRLGPISPGTQDRLMAAVVPSFSVENATVEETVVILNGLLNEKLPSSGLKLGIWEKPNLPKKKRTAEVSKLGTTEVSQPLPQRRITLMLREIPFLELLKYVSAMSGDGIAANCTLGQRGNTLYLVDGDGAFELVTRTYTLPPDLIEQLRREEPEQFLAASGVRFEYEGSFAEVTESGKLRIRNVPDQLDLFETLGPIPDRSFLELLKLRWSALRNR